MFTVIKSYRDLPAAHRQPNHEGHCQLIHGHNWGFDITFSCRFLDGNGFVIDVGELKRVKQMLEELFDHTLLLNIEDPLALPDDFPVRVVRVPNCGMEGLAQHVLEQINILLVNGSVGEDARDRNVIVERVVCLEDSKNMAAFQR